MKNNITELIFILDKSGSMEGLQADTVGGFNAMKALSTRHDDPEHASRPFSASRDGFVIGEGAGCTVLEELEHAQARNAKIYAEVVGYGATCDAYHMTAPLPDGSGFGAALAGSTLHAARAYLRLPASSATSLRLLVTPPTGMPRTVCPEYNDEPCIMLNGIIQGSLRKGQPIPAHWPKGVYITPTRKILHRP